MVEHWLAIEIYTKSPSIKYRNLLIKLVDIVWNKSAATKFHFFHEDWDKSEYSESTLKKIERHLPKEMKGYMFLMRFRFKEKRGIGYARKIFEQNKKIIRGIYKKIRFPKYIGEARYYSADGWEHVQDYFQICSILGASNFKGKWMNTSKLVHTLLNQYGYSTYNEFGFYFRRATSLYWSRWER